MDGKTEAVAFLLEHGANPQTKAWTYKKDHFLLDALSDGSGTPEIVALLKKAGAHSAIAK
jgi:hypothetical protein